MSLTVAQAAWLAEVAKAAQAVAAQSGVPASFTVAQAALESRWGQSGLALRGNNLFGIKADTSWSGNTILLATREVVGGRDITINAKFRAYPDFAASILDHAKFFHANHRYAGCFPATSGEAFARSVARAGYATDPHYADSLIAVIRTHQLDRLDSGADMGLLGSWLDKALAAHPADAVAAAHALTPTVEALVSSLPAGTPYHQVVDTTHAALVTASTHPGGSLAGMLERAGPGLVHWAITTAAMAMCVELPALAPVIKAAATGVEVALDAALPAPQEEPALQDAPGAPPGAPPGASVGLPPL